MGSTVQEDSNVIQNIQCSTTAAAPVTAGPDVTTVSGDLTDVTMIDDTPPFSPPGGMVTSDSGMVTTTGATEVTTIISENPSDSTNNDIPPIPSTTTPAASTPLTTSPTTTTPAATTPVVTTPVVTTPAATTPATTTPAPTTLAVSEQQRAACLVAIEADGNKRNKFHHIKQLFQHKKKPFAMN